MARARYYTEVRNKLWMIDERQDSDKVVTLNIKADSEWSDH